MNVMSALGGLNTASILAAGSSYASAQAQATSSQANAGQAMGAESNAAYASGSVSENTTAQDSGSAFTRYTSQYRRLTSIVLDSGGKYDHDQQMRAYMELRSMAASGKLKGMQADDQRVWMQVNNSSVSLLQTESDSTSATSATSSTDSTESTSLLTSDDDSQNSGTVSSSYDNDTVELSPTAQEIIDYMQAQQEENDSTQTTALPLQTILASEEDSSSGEIGSVISLTV